MEPSCRIELMGGLRVRQAERLITRFRTQKAAALLAYLAYYPRQSHPREVLIQLLWPDLDLDAGRNNLSTILTYLRHQLEPPGLPAGAVLVADRLSLGIRASAITTDVAEFEGHIRASETVTGDTARMQALSDAIACYTGELLPGYYEDWVQTERERLAEVYLQATRRMIRLLVKMGEMPRALDYARQAVHTDPLREESQRDLIRLYAATGQPSAALQQYHQFEALLLKELGQAPSATTRELARQIQSKSIEVGKRQRSSSASTQALRQAKLEEAAERLPFCASGAAPTGTVTFLLVEVEESRANLQHGAKTLSSALPATLWASFQQHGGHLFQQGNGSFRLAFAGAANALVCAVAIQQSVAQRAEQEPHAKVRVALHTGDVKAPGDYHGPVLSQALRMLVAGHGGQILCSEATAVLLHRDLDTGIRLADLGVYRLRDIATPERLFQVEYPEMPQRQFPPLNAEAGYASTLPLQLTRFFGREAELSRLQELLLLPETRLVTLTGPGGTGKTRLAVEAARRLVEAFAGSVWFVPLADVTAGDLIPRVLLEALRLPHAKHTEPLEQIVEALSRQPTLLVFDNFEHLVEKGAPLVQTLLARVPTLTCLVTSRQCLALAGEHEVWVSPLPIPQSAGTPEQLLLYTSVQLFVDRAQAVRPDFQITGNNAAAVAQLCAGLEGLPLAIELAAARAQVVTPAQMLSQLQHRLEFLVSRKRDAAERHRTMRAAIDWSYNLLAADLQQFFAQLSVFRGGWTLEAAETVCQEPLALDYLAQLRECSLVRTEESAPGRKEMRFRMLEMLRAYGEEKLTPKESERLQRRHLEYFLALAEEAGDRLAGPEQTQWLERLEAEHDNFRAALAWCQANDVETGMRLAGGLVDYWRMRGYLSEGRAHLAALLASADAVGPTKARAEALNGAGLFAWIQGDYAQARALHEESLALYRELGNKQGMAVALNGLGAIAYYQGDYEMARSLSEEGLLLNRETGNRVLEATNLQNLGLVAQARTEYMQAHVLFRESLAIRRALGDRSSIAHSLNNLGYVALVRGDYEAARVLYEESLAIQRELGERGAIAYSLNILGYIALVRGDYETADGVLHESLAIRRELGDKLGLAYTLHNLGNLARYRNDYAAARAFHGEALKIRQDLNSKTGIAESLQAFAELEKALTRLERATRLFAAAEALRATSGHSQTSREQEEYDRSLRDLRTRLGEPGFTAAWAAGQTMSVEQAIDFTQENLQVEKERTGA